VTLSADPLDVSAAHDLKRRADGSLSISWRERTCKVVLHGPVTKHSLDHLRELLVGVGPAGKRVLISLADAVVTREIGAELAELSERLAGDGAVLELLFVPGQGG
jgi:hypothetical protein